ncbi:branched-chain amino acid ABC transporter permease [Bacillota bacterium LX-D]|nr:branched-chain amino acid ABC transporter permease [Bacillota bacterium LX-D]
MKLKNILIAVILLAIYGAIYFAINVAQIIDPYQQVSLFLMGINIIAAVSLNLIVGFTGQLALGHAGFMAIGAYVSAVMTLKLGQPFIVAVLAGALVSGIIGIIIGLPTLRLKGDYLAIATLGFGEIIRGLLVNIEYVGGAAGLNGIPQLTTFSWLYLFTVFTVLIISNFINSTHGRACIAIRDNEIAAETMGINTTYYKTFAFSMGAFFAGIAGALYAHYYFLIQPTTFTFMRSFDALVMVVFGGLGSITGSIIAAIAVTGINSLLIDFGALRMVIYSILLIIIMVFRPQGLMGAKEFTLQTLFKKYEGGKRGHAEN